MEEEIIATDSAQEQPPVGGESVSADTIRAIIREELRAILNQPAPEPNPQPTPDQNPQPTPDQNPQPTPDQNPQPDVLNSLLQEVQNLRSAVQLSNLRRAGVDSLQPAMTSADVFESLINPTKK